MIPSKNKVKDTINIPISFPIPKSGSNDRDLTVCQIWIVAIIKIRDIAEYPATLNFSRKN